MDGRGYASASPQRVFQVDRTTVLFQQIAERLVGELLKILHLVVPEQIELPPGFFIELQALARHYSARLLHRANNRGRTFKLPSFGRHCPAPGQRVIDEMLRYDLS